MKKVFRKIQKGTTKMIERIKSLGEMAVSYTHLYPYRAVTYATQKIIRQSNVTVRSLVPTCRLLHASRSDDNPNGFTIEAVSYTHLRLIMQGASQRTRRNNCVRLTTCYA